MKALSYTLIGFIAALLFVGAGHTTIQYTNTTSFCISCHEMEDNVYQEYKTSKHFQNASGVSAQCSDCHVPKELFPKLVRKVGASKDLYHWLLGTIDNKEKFSAHRLKMAEQVWSYMEQSDSRECRSCHNFEDMALSDQGLFAQAKHQSAREEGKTCINCHQGIVHALPKIPKTDNSAQLGKFVYDPDYGEEINETCAGCHGEKAEGSMDGEYPRLAGLPATYITKQLIDFKHRERINLPMIPYTNERELPAGDVFQVAEFISQIELPTHQPEENAEGVSSYDRLLLSKFIVNIPRFDGNPQAGENSYQRECKTCHGRDAMGIVSKGAPRLAGQHSIYLQRQIKQYREGTREHDYSPQDQQVFLQMSDTTINNILAYLSVLDD